MEAFIGWEGHNHKETVKRAICFVVVVFLYFFIPCHTIRFYKWSQFPISLKRRQLIIITQFELFFLLSPRIKSTASLYKMSGVNVKAVHAGIWEVFIFNKDKIEMHIFRLTDNGREKKYNI